MSLITNHLKSQSQKSHFNSMRASEGHWNYAYVPSFNDAPVIKYRKDTPKIGYEHNFEQKIGTYHTMYGSYPTNTVHVNILASREDNRKHNLKKIVTQDERWNSILV